MTTIGTPQIVRIKLDTARDQAPFPGLSGRFLTVYNASGYAAAAEIWVNDVFGQPYPFRRGTVFENLPINRVYLRNTAQAGEWLDVLVYGDPTEADPERFRFVLPATATEVEVVNTVEVLPAEGALIVQPENGKMAVTHPYDGKVHTLHWPYLAYPGVWGINFQTASTSWVLLAEVPSDQWYLIEGAMLTSGASAYCQIKIDNESDVQVCTNQNCRQTTYTGVILQGMVIPPGHKVYMKTTDGAQPAAVFMWGRVKYGNPIYT